MIIFDELSFAEWLLGNTKRVVTVKDLAILAKYWRYEGDSYKEIEKKLINFCEERNPNFNRVKNYKTIKFSVSVAKKYHIRIPDKVIITENEINAIRRANNYQYERVLFAMLVVAKFFKVPVKIKPGRKPKLIGYYISKFNDVVNVAKVRMNKTKRNEMLHYFYLEKFIDATYSGGLRISYADDSSVPHTVVDEFDDIMKFYPRLCAACSKPTENNSIYCCNDDCKKEREKAKNRERVYRHRKKIC